MDENNDKKVKVKEFINIVTPYLNKLQKGGLAGEIQDINFLKKTLEKFIKDNDSKLEEYFV